MNLITRFLKYFYKELQKLPSGYAVVFGIFIVLINLVPIYGLNLVDYYYSMVYKSPIQWQGIDISLPKGTKYSFDERFIDGVFTSSVKLERFFPSSPVSYGSFYTDYGDGAPAEENLFSGYAGLPFTHAVLHIDYFPEGRKEKMIEWFRKLKVYLLNRTDVISVVSNINDEFFEITASKPYNLVYDMRIYRKCYLNFCFAYYGLYKDKIYFKNIIEDVGNRLNR